MARFPTGTTFLGRYLLTGPIGTGGVSVVYQALDTNTGRHVAIKILDPHLAGDARALAKMRHEAVITQRMRHPSVPRVHDYGEAAVADGLFLSYVVMDQLFGTLLAEHLAKGPLTWQDAIRVSAGVADVLSVAHKRGIVHRDLTPANIMITTDGAKILDFGAAVTIALPGRRTGALIAPTPTSQGDDFSGPGEPADDIYALGVLLYQMLTGRSPYPEASQDRPTAAASMKYVAPSPVLSVPGLPRSVADVCRRLMARRPTDRPAAGPLALELWALAEPSSVPMRLATDPSLRELPVAATAGRTERPAIEGSRKPQLKARPAVDADGVPVGYTGGGGRHRRRHRRRRRSSSSTVDPAPA